MFRARYINNYLLGRIVRVECIDYVVHLIIKNLTVRTQPLPERVDQGAQLHHVLAVFSLIFAQMPPDMRHAYSIRYDR